MNPSRVFRVIPIGQAIGITGGVSQTSKMPCTSYSLPTAACHTGSKMAKIEGSICSTCYADKGNYRLYANNIEPAQVARLGEVLAAMEDPAQAELWVDAMVALAGRGPYFRWHDSGDLQGPGHLALIVAVALATPDTKHWLPTREYGMVKDWLAQGNTVPANLKIRLSAMYPDKPVVVPASLQGVPGVTTSEVHRHLPATAQVCPAPAQGNECGDCRTCWTDTPVSYAWH